MVEIIPAILTNDIREIEEKLKRAETLAQRVQIDVLDGQFVANRTVDPSFVGNIETDLTLDFHLMTKEPIDWVERAVRGGADRIIGQIEQMANQLEFVGKVSEVGLSVGLALDLDSEVSELDPTILNNLDVVLVMSVKAGFGGQKFDPKAIKKIKDLDKIRVRDDTPFKICVDGGITKENIKEVTKAVADEVAIGGRIFEGDLAQNLERFRKAAYG